MIKSIEKVADGCALLIDDRFRVEVAVRDDATWITSVSFSQEMLSFYRERSLFARNMASLYAYQFRRCPGRPIEWTPIQLIEYWIDFDHRNLTRDNYKSYRQFVPCIGREAKRML